MENTASSLSKSEDLYDLCTKSPENFMPEVGEEDAEHLEKMNQRAMRLISSTISQDLCSVYSMHDTPYSLWTALENKYEGTQDQRTNRTLREFFGLTYEKIETISEFIDRFNEKLGRVAETRQVINESLKVCIFTLALKNTQYFQRADTWSIAHPTGKLNELMNTVLQQDPQERSSTERNVAYSATGKKIGLKVTCNFCKKPGHLKKDC